jgi:hypothetical protein
MSTLNLRQNGLHTLHHAIEHLEWSTMANRDGGRVFDHDDHTVSWREGSSLCFVAPEFTRLPEEYNLKFAVLHLIQAAELLLKSYVHQQQPSAIFASPGSTKTIGLQQALAFTTARNPNLFMPDEIALLMQAKQLRNSVEHYEFTFDAEKLRLLCIDFVSICMLVCQDLLSINIAEVFSWDALKNRPDPVGDYLSALSGDLSVLGKLVAQKTASAWLSDNKRERVFLCLNCGAKSVSRERGICMGCGAEGDEETAKSIEEFEAALKAKVRLESWLRAKTRKTKDHSGFTKENSP